MSRLGETDRALTEQGTSCQADRARDCVRRIIGAKAKWREAEIAVPAGEKWRFLELSVAFLESTP